MFHFVRMVAVAIVPVVVLMTVNTKWPGVLGSAATRSGLTLVASGWGFLILMSVLDPFLKDHITTMTAAAALPFNFGGNSHAESRGAAINRPI